LAHERVFYLPENSGYAWVRRDSLSRWIRLDCVGGQARYKTIFRWYPKPVISSRPPVGRYDDDATATVHRPFVAVADAHSRMPSSLAIRV